MPLFFMHVRSTRYLIWVGRPCIFYVVMEWYCVRFDSQASARIRATLAESRQASARIMPTLAERE